MKECRLELDYILSHILNSFSTPKNEIHRVFYEGTKAGSRMLKAQHIAKISSNWSDKVIENSPLKILSTSPPLIAFLKSIQAITTLDVA